MFSVGFLEKVSELEEENQSLKLQINNPVDEVDIGNGIMLKNEFIVTIKAASPSTNAFGRCLLRKLFENDEIIGYSLMGKGCAANKTETLPSIDPRRRDALIGKTNGCELGQIYFGLFNFSL